MWRKAHFWFYLLGICLIAYGGWKWWGELNQVAPLPVYSSASSVKSSQPKDKPLVLPKGPLYKKQPKVGETIGVLEIPRLKAKLPIIHGTSESQLARGVGHYKKSVLPGEKDNSLLSGHRDTVFRRMGEIKIGDKFIVQTEAGIFTYQVKKSRIVDQHDRKAIVSTYPKPQLTVSTCYPFSYIGFSPQRYLLIADLVDFQLNK
ncbi:class D sortase [Paenactinomyces guangxiensis]|uniref:Class D sortase n=1 Tax=Paenactinomyces guangxiensis TaxID=1490290 RepID=A0A7W2A8U0_9BACL|nr:class D sortase [Paenactinomyces guangxiensis]MBA4494522.1 class D sortase [Paenactinomyces guangxiensis]MBH8591716.1 class D sortase [Paenactinomyces guangxiensis]